MKKSLVLLFVPVLVLVLVLVFVFVQIQVGQTQTTWFPFSERIGAGNFKAHLLLSDGDTTYVCVSSAGDHFATDVTNSVFYHYNTTQSRLEKRSLTTGALLANHSFLAQICLFVDSGGKLWTINNTDSSVVRKWNSDLTLNTKYTMKSGILISDDICHLCMTYDEQYVYVIDEQASNNCLAKIAVSNLNGGDEEWAVDVPNTIPYFVCCDDSDNVYLSGITNVYLTKYNAAGTLKFATAFSFGNANIGSMRFYINSTNRVILTTMNNVSSANSSMTMVNAATGTVIGTTAALSNGNLYTVCLVDTFCFVGTTAVSGSRYIHQIGINTNWSSRAYVNRHTTNTGYQQYMIGDPSGDVHGDFSPPAASTSKNIIVIF